MHIRTVYRRYIEDTMENCKKMEESNFKKCRHSRNKWRKMQKEMEVTGEEMENHKWKKNVRLVGPKDSKEDLV